MKATIFSNPVRHASLLLLLTAAQLTIPAWAQSTNWTSGINGLNVSYGYITDTDVVDNATLMVTNGGNLTAGQLLVGPTNAATLILSNNASITVAQLLVTNNSFGVTNSTFNFSGGTLVTSNYNSLAASILIASNANYTINGNWTMNAGTNLITQPPGVTNTGTGNKSVNIGTAAANSGLVISVNTNALWLLGTIPINNPESVIPGVSTNVTTTNNFNLALGAATGSTNNQLVINGGVVSNVFVLNIGNANSSVGNQLIITNGGQFYCGFNASNAGGLVSCILGSNTGASSNSVVVMGTNSSGGKSILDFGAERIQIGNGQSAKYNSMRVDQGGIITNGTLYMIASVNSSFIITNGGMFMAVGQQAMIGRNNSTNNLVIVAGADSAGNPSTFNNFNQNVAICAFNVGTASNNGTNNGIWISQGGLLTNVPTIYVGGEAANETNNTGNFLIITNGGSCYSTSSTIGFGTNDNGNWAYVGGLFGTTNALWYLNGGTVTVGGSYTSNNAVIVGPGGVVTNIGTLLVGASSLATNSSVTVNGGNLYATNVIVTTNSYLTLLNNGTVTSPTNITARGGTIAGSGTFNASVSIAPQGMLAPGGLGTIGTLTINSNLLLNGSSSLLFDFLNTNTAGTTYDQVVIGGSLVFAGNSFLQLNVSTGWVTNGTYTLMTYPQGRQGQGAVVFPVTGTTNWGNLWLTNGPTSLVLGVTTTTQLSALANNLTWKGTGGNNGTWDSAADTATLNWSSNGVSQTYADGDFVRFDDTASFFTVTNNSGSAGYSPGDVIFANSANNYVLGAAINGAATVTLAGNKTVMFTGTNTYTGNTFISGGGNLIVTNGGSLYSPAATLNVQFGTNTLAGGSITVKTLLAANNSFGVNNSTLTLSSGTLTTSNLNGLASTILLASNASYTINANWNMNAGTNFILTPPGVTNVGSPTLTLGGSVAGDTLAINSNATLITGYTPVGNNNFSNNYTITLGGTGGLTNNTLIINGGTLTNCLGINVGVATGANANQLLITNGGQAFIGNSTAGQSQVGNGSQSNNVVIVAGASSSGVKSLWDFGSPTGGSGAARLYLGTGNANFNNSVIVGQGGVINSANVYTFGLNNTMLVTNGGVLNAYGITWGRSGTNNNLIVAGADSNGNLATLNGLNQAIYVGGGGTPTSPGSKAFGNGMWVFQNAIVTNIASLYVGGSTTVSGADTNCNYNFLIITNGGQIVGESGGATIGYSTNCNNNYIYVGGAFGSTNALWNASGHTLIIGGGYPSTLNFSNTLTVATGGVVTNITTLTVGNDSTCTNNGVTVGGGSLYATTVNVTTNNYLTLTNNGTVVATVNVNGGIFGGSGTNNGAVNIFPQGTLALGGYGAQGSIGTLTISNLNLSGNSQLIFTLVNSNAAGSTFDQIGINSSLMVAGNSFLQLNVPTGWVTNGTYTLMTYPQGRQGLGNVVFPVTGTTNWGNLQLANGSTSLVLKVAATTQLSAAATNLTWSGFFSGTWDSATTSNWRSNGAAQTYVDGDFVAFDDTAFSYTVTNNGGSSGFSPGSVQFVNNANNYLIGAAINGAISVALDGNKTVAFAGTNTYTGNTIVNGGVLQVGTNSGSGQIWTNILLTGGNLAYNLTNNYKQQGVIASDFGASGITNTGTYVTATNTLKLADGFNLFTNIANNSGTLILTGSANSTNYFTASSTGAGSSLIPAAGATIQLNSGNYMFTNGNQSAGGGSLIVNGGNIYAVWTNSGGAGMNGLATTNYTQNSGTVVVGGGGGFYQMVNNDTFNLNNGNLTLLPNAYRAVRFGSQGGSAGGGPSVNFTGTQTGGTFAISAAAQAGGTYGFDLGGTNSSAIAAYTISGGILMVTNATGAQNVLGMGAATNAGNTALTMFTLNGTGAVLMNGNIGNSFGGGSAFNPNVVFAFDGGTLACQSFQAFGLRSDVSGGAFGVLTNVGGRLAPGFTNNAGLMTINGSYVQTATGTLDIDIDGATAAGGFLTYPSPVGYDQLVVTNQTTLNGTLFVRTNGSFSPTAFNSFTVVTNYATGAGLSATFNNIYNNSVAVWGGLGYSFQVVTNANTLVLTNFSPLIAAWTVVNPGGPSPTVTFTNNNSIGAITNWAVDFGDGSPVENHPFTDPNSTLGSVGTSYTYSVAPGFYTATLTVYASDGTTAQTTYSIAVSGNVDIWTGAGDSFTWDINNTQNWNINGGQSAYSDGDQAVFDDSGLANPNVTLNLTVTPGSVTFSNTTAGNYTISGTGGITGLGGLTQWGTGTNILSTANNFTGGTFVNAGGLELLTGGSFSNSTVNVAAAGTFVEDPSSRIAGAAGFVNSGTTTLAGTNTYTGGTSITAGTLALSGSLSNSAVNVAAGTFTETGSGNLGGTGSFANSGTTTLAGANTYTGGTTLSAGQLNFNNAGALGTGTLIINGGSLDNTSGVSLNDSQNNAQSWNGDFTFVGSTNLNLGTGAVTPNGSHQVTVSASKLTVGGVIGGGAVSVTKAGAGTLALAGANTYSGNTLINAGTLQTTASGVLALTSAVNFSGATSATLDIQGTVQTVANLLFTNIAPTSTITINGTNGSLFVSPSTLDIRPWINTNTFTLNMSGLTSFTYTNSSGTFTVNNGLNSSTLNSTTPTIVTLAGGTNLITAATINVANANTSAGVDNSTLNLGTNNTLNVGTINFGSGRTGGTIQFASGIANGKLTIAGVTGGSSLATLTSGGGDSFQFIDKPVNLFDTTAGTLTAQFGTMTIGQIGEAAGTNRGINITASFKMGAGTLTAANMTLAVINSASSNTNGTYAITGLFFLTNGGTASITNLTLGVNNLIPTNTASLTNVATVSLTNGATLYATSIQPGNNANNLAIMTSQLLLGGGTLGNIVGGNLNISNNVKVVLLGSTTTNNLNISAGQTGTIGGVVSGAGALTKIGAGTLALTNVNTYTGPTLVSVGTLALSGSGSIANTPLISVTNGAVFNVAGLSSTFTLSSGQTLSNSAVSTGTLNGSLTTASSSVVSVTYDGTGNTPAFTETNGTLTLNPATIFTINNTGTQLGAGSSSKIVSKATTGNVGTVAFAGTAPAVSVNGNGAAGAVSLATNNGELYVNVAGGAHTNAYLTGITLTPVLSFTPAFASNMLSGYVAMEAYSANFTVTVTNADGTASNYLSYHGNGVGPLTNALASGMLSPNVNPAVTNVVLVTVTAQDGLTTRTYVVNVVELPDQTVKPVLTNSYNNGTLMLNWPLANLGYRLLVQTNSLANGLSTNALDWGPVPNSTATNRASIITTNVDDYYRLVYP